jgi:hypothetical protein
LLWCGFAVFWEFGALATRAPFFFKLWGIPFVVAGLYFVFGRFIVDVKQREKTYYGLTDQSVIIVSGFIQKKVKTLNLRSISDISLTEHSTGRGTITFGPTPPFYGWFGGSSWPGMGQYSMPSFERIDDAKDVYNLLNRTSRSTSTLS